MLLTPDQEMIRDAVRAFAQEQLWPHAAEWDRTHHFPKAAHQGLAELGCYGICVPESYGGAGLDYVTLALVLEERRLGEALLMAADRIGRGVQGDLRGVTEGLSLLRLAGLEDIARRTALELMLLERRG